MKQNISCIDPIVEFPKVEKMLYALAWKFSKAHRLPFEDTRSEAYAGFMKACNNFRPNKGMKFSSWCYFVTWGYLKSWIMKRAADPLCFMEINEELVGAEPDVTSDKVHRLLSLTEKQPLQQTLLTLFRESPAELWEATEDLSAEAEELFYLFLEAPTDVITSRNKAEQLQQAKQHLAQRYGEQKAEHSFRELRGRLGEAWAC